MVLKLRVVSVQLLPTRLKTGSQFLVTALRCGQNHGRVPLNLEGSAVSIPIDIKLAGSSL